MTDNIARALALQAQEKAEITSEEISENVSVYMATYLEQHPEYIATVDAVVISDTEPDIDRKCLWIKPEEYESFDVPQINDESVSAEDTWSSKKISDELNALSTQGLSYRIVEGGV